MLPTSHHFTLQDHQLFDSFLPPAFGAINHLRERTFRLTTTLNARHRSERFCSPMSKLFTRNKTKLDESRVNKLLLGWLMLLRDFRPLGWRIRHLQGRSRFLRLVNCLVSAFRSHDPQRIISQTINKKLLRLFRELKASMLFPQPCTYLFFASIQGPGFCCRLFRLSHTHEFEFAVVNFRW